MKTPAVVSPDWPSLKLVTQGAVRGPLVRSSGVGLGRNTGTPVRADAAPSAGSEVILRYGYHPLPYDNTGQGPGQTGMEGGGG